ncbi:MAG: hypothetical protein LAQ30_25485 [Acidobacteriia bacterium]|nr:hypothetical protein [Terriglobia bacterium]
MYSTAGERSVPAEPGGRSHVVTFRVSGEEFGLLVRARALSEARSLSSFARRAVLEKVRSLEEPSNTLSGDLSTLATTLAELDTALRQISTRIRSILGLPKPDGATPDTE